MRTMYGKGKVDRKGGRPGLRAVLVRFCTYEKLSETNIIQKVGNAQNTLKQVALFRDMIVNS